MSQMLHQIDAFTATPFAGNPAAVAVLDAPAEENWMQQVAREMNLSETAFVVPRDSHAPGEPAFDLRWFTPTTEVDLCGHATLATAHHLFESGAVALDATIRFHTASGVLHAKRRDDTLWLDFPAEPPVPAAPPDGLFEALGLTDVVAVGRNRMDYLVHLASADQVRSLAPDLTQLATIATRGVIVTAMSDDRSADFISRFFAPAAGVPEDPVTGSAHCALGPYWQQQLGRAELTGFQASTRGGTVHVRTAEDRVALGGQAVTVLRAELLIP